MIRIRKIPIHQLVFAIILGIGSSYYIYQPFVLEQQEKFKQRADERRKLLDSYVPPIQEGITVDSGSSGSS